MSDDTQLDRRDEVEMFPMRSRQEIEAELERVEADVRLAAPAASFFSNYILAAIQMELKGQADTLRWVLGLPARKYHGKE